MGPALGGFIGEAYGLHAPFYFVAATVALVAVNNYMRLPETNPHHPKLLNTDVVRLLASDIRGAAKQWKSLLQLSGMVNCILRLELKPPLLFSHFPSIELYGAPW